MDQKEFADILKRYRKGDATPKERDLVDAWYEALGNEHADEGVGADLGAEAKNWSAITSHIRNGTKEDGRRRLIPWHLVGIAASLIIAFAVYRIVGRHDVQSGRLADQDFKESADLKQFANESTSQEEVLLPDSSRVALGPKSEVTFSNLMKGRERRVNLRGEAFFKVSHDAKRAFIVNAHGVTTKVLGTEFSIKAFQDEQTITVKVRSGTVAVYPGDDSEADGGLDNGIILTENQQIIYNKLERRVSRSLVDNPNLIIPVEIVKKMRFEDAPVSRVFEALEKTYGIHIQFDEKRFSSCNLTTSVSDQGLYSRLTIICQAIHATYAVKEDHIEINGTGCGTK